MKKLAIAGASLALAAMPVVGVFATTTKVDDNSLTDTLNITNQISCAMTSAHTAGSAAETPSWSAEAGSATLTATVATGTEYSNLGSTTFTVICNDINGWGVNAAFGDLTGTTDSNYKVTNGALSSSTSHYSATPSTTSSSISTGDANSSPVATSSVAAVGSGEAFTMTYGAQIDTDVKAQTYQGNVVYTLYHNVVSD